MHVLMIEDRPEDRELIARRLQHHFPSLQLTQASDERAFRQALEQGPFDLVLTDYALHWTDGLQVLRAVKARFPQVPVVMFTESGSEEVAAEGMHEGLSDYLLKKHLERLPAAIQASLERARLQTELDQTMRDLMQSHSELEARVRERTAELAAANAALQAEVQERERLAAETQRQAAELDSIFSAMPDLVAVYDAQGRITRINPAGEQLTRYPSERYGRLMAERMTLRRFEAGAERRPLAPEETPVGRALRGEPVQNELVAMVEGEGSEETVTWLLVSATPVHGPAGEITGVVAISKDITAQKRAEVALSESEERYRLLFEHMNEGFVLGEILCDEAGRPVDYRHLAANPALEKVTGIKGEELLGEMRGEVDLPPSRWIEIFGRVALTGQPASFEDYSAWLNRYYSISAYSPRPGQFAYLVQDITARKQAEEALREAMAQAQAGQRLLEAALEYVPGGITISDAEGALLRVSRFGKELLGDTFEGRATSEATGGVIYRTDGITPLPYEEIPLIRALHGGEVVQDVEVVHLDAQGRPLSLLCNAAPIRDAEGQVVGGIVTWSDITERKQAEQELAEQALMLNNLNDAVIGTDRSYRINYWSPSAERMYGYRREEAMGQYAGILQPAFFGMTNQEALSRLERTGELNVELTHTTQDGRKIIVGSRTQILYDGRGERKGLISINRDITASKQVEERLQAERQERERLFVRTERQAAELEAALTAMPSGVMILDPEGRIVRMNTTAEQLLGYSVAERALPVQERMSVVEFRYPGKEERPRIEELPFWRAQHGETLDGELVTFQPQAAERPIPHLLSAAPIRMPDGAISGSVVTMRDVSSLFAMQERLEEANASLEQRNTELQTSEQALRESEERFHLALGGSDITVATLDADRRYTWVYNTRHGFSPEQTVGKRAEELLPLEEVAETVAQQKQVLETGVGDRREVHRVTDGKEWFYDSLIEPLRDEFGQVIGLTYVAVDITARKQAAEALRKSEAKLRAVFRSLAEGVVFLNPQGEVVETNEAVQRLHGQTLQELADPQLDPRGRILRPDGTLFPVEEQPAIVALRTGEAVYDVEMGVPTSDGRLRWRVVNAQPVYDDEGKLLGAVASFFDISERKRAEDEQKRLLSTIDGERARLQAILDSLPVGVWVADAEGRMILANDAAGKVYAGRPPLAENIEEYSVYQVWQPDTGERVPVEDYPLPRALRGESVKDMVMDFERFDGTRGTQSCSSAPIRDAQGQLLGGVVIAQDITAQRQVEREREELLLKQGQLLEQARKDAATRATLLQEINHRVKNNLAAIVGLIYAQQDRPGVRDQPVYRAVLGDLERWVQGFSVVHGLLSAAQWAPLPLDNLVQAIVASCARTVLPGKVAVQMQCVPLPISSELAQPLALVVNEVVTNMARHAFGERRAGQLIVTGRQEGTDVLLTLRDDGPGYPEEVLAGEQFGVGLELVRNLVQRNLRGRMVLHNEGGAVAEIRFPLARSVS